MTGARGRPGTPGPEFDVSEESMRVKVVRTPGELRDEIGHRIMVHKDWTGTVVRVLEGKEIEATGFHPKASEQVYEVLFDQWEQSVAVPGVNLVEIPDEPEPPETQDA